MPLIPVRYALPALIAVALLGAAAAALRSEPYARDASPPSEVCLGCHAGQDTTLAATPHRLRDGGTGKAGARIACASCHAPDSRHWEEDPTQYPMPVPSKLGAAAEGRVCSACHQNSHQQNMQESNVHARNDVACSGCHSVHGSTRHALLKADQPGLCLSCHARVEGQFARSYRHPVNDGVVKCSECHQTLDETRRELAQNGNSACVKCHGEFEGPFVFEHQATVDYSTEEGGCLSCHEPHGSNVPRMLKQPLEAPRFQLCTQCHSVPGHDSNPMHGTRWAGMACNQCHTDIHGSYTSRLFLSESLEGQGCFNVGCHKF
jgi:DmsE family decaheme c-type cytochrome